MTAKQKEKVFWELDTILSEMDGELKMANSLGCGSLVSDSYHDQYHAVCDDFWKVANELEAIWKEDSTAVSPKLSEYFEEQEKLYEEMAQMAADDSAFYAWIEEQKIYEKDREIA